MKRSPQLSMRTAASQEQEPAVHTVSRRAMLLAVGAAMSTLPVFGKIRGVELGVTGRPADFLKAQEYGFDYFEPNGTTVARMSDADYAAFRDQVKGSRIYCQSVVSLLSGPDLKVVGPDANLDAVYKYLDAAFDRYKPLGLKVAVWGSSGSRKVPDGYSRDLAWNQIVKYLKGAGEIAQKKQIVIGIEPLRHQESNIINTGAEALKLVHDVNHPGVKMIIDYYHMRVENEDPDIVLTAKDEIVHFHFANPAGRRWPHSVDEDPVMYKKFFANVKKIDFHGGLSIEGNGTFEADGAASLAFFKSMLA